MTISYFWTNLLHKIISYIKKNLIQNRIIVYNEDIANEKDIANLWCWDNVQNFKTRFVFEKYGPNEKKNSIKKNVFFLNFTIVTKNFIQILGTDIQNFGEARLILYDINLFEK